MRKNIKLPKGAKRVFHGKIFDAYHWRQKMYDGTYQTFERLARADTVSIIAVTKDKKFLIQRQSQPHYRLPFWSLPGGRVDDGERLHPAAKRELLEETGYSASRWKLWKSAAHVSKIDWDIHTFIAYGCEKVQKPTLDAGERIRTFEVSFQRFIDLMIHKDFGGRDLTIEILRAKADPRRMRQLKKLLLS